MSNTYHVLIVGGGPAGLAAAEAAAKRGVQTLILERQQEIGYPIHTSGGSWIEDMHLLGIPEHLYHPTPLVTFLSPQREVRLQYFPAVACVMDVRGVYQHLAERAVNAGAQIRLCHTVERAQLERNSVVGVVARNQVNERFAVRAKLVIDASGFSRHIAVRTGMGRAFRRYGFGAEY